MVPAIETVKSEEEETMEGGEEVKKGREDKGYVKKFLCDCGEEFTKRNAFRRHKCKVKLVKQSKRSHSLSSSFPYPLQDIAPRWLYGGSRPHSYGGLRPQSYGGFMAPEKLLLVCRLQRVNSST